MFMKSCSDQLILLLIDFAGLGKQSIDIIVITIGLVLVVGIFLAKLGGITKHVFLSVHGHGPS